MFENLEYLRTVEMPSCYPKVDLDQTWETPKEGAPIKGFFISNFEHDI
jgi:hypothetical protein